MTAILRDSYAASQPGLPQKPFHIVSPLLPDTASELLREHWQESAVQLEKANHREHRENRGR